MAGKNAGATVVPPMIFFNVGWMKRYGGTAKDDPTLGRHRHLRQNVHGAEAYNFAPVKGCLYGYRPPGDRGISIKRLGAPPGADRMQGVTVVWMALRPGTGETAIVGWYLNATVFRRWQPLPAHVHPGKGQYREYAVTADEANSRLLPVDARNFLIRSVRRLPGGFGQSPTYYDEDNIYRDRVWRFIQRTEGNVSAAGKGRQKGSPRNQDAAKRRLVETTAVEHATAYYSSAEGGGYEVVSVERDAAGWDLECTRGDEKLLVEVKGCSGPDIRAELTPNEYAKLLDPKYSAQYVIYVVTNCLSTVPSPSIFRYAAPDIWQTDDGRTLLIEPLEAARISSES